MGGENFIGWIERLYEKALQSGQPILEMDQELLAILFDNIPELLDLARKE